MYFDKSVIDWKVIAGAWLKDRRQLEAQVTKISDLKKTKQYAFDDI